MDELVVNEQVVIPLTEIDMHAIRSQGAGGQNVNKVSTAIHLRFDARQSPSLPDDVRGRLLSSNDSRIGADGIITIKAQQHRTQRRNRDDALQRLRVMLEDACKVPKPRKKTRPSAGAVAERLKNKRKRAERKAGRLRPTLD